MPTQATGGMIEALVSSPLDTGVTGGFVEALVSSPLDMGVTGGFVEALVSSPLDMGVVGGFIEALVGPAVAGASPYVPRDVVGTQTVPYWARGFLHRRRQ